jgi:hypothetical protein
MRVDPATTLPGLALAACLLMPNETLSDVLPPSAAPEVEFMVTDRQELPFVSISLSFLSDGYRRLPPGATATVNGAPLVLKPLQKRGFRYHAEMQRAERYILSYTRSSDQPPVQLTIRPYLFQPAVPATVSRSQGFVVRYEGPALPAGTEAVAIFAFQPPGQPERNRGATLFGKVQGQSLEFPAARLQKLPLGNGTLQVGISLQSVAGQPPGHTLVYASSLTHAVSVSE